MQDPEQGSEQMERKKGNRSFRRDWSNCRRVRGEMSNLNRCLKDSFLRLSIKVIARPALSSPLPFASSSLFLFPLRTRSSSLRNFHLYVWRSSLCMFTFFLRSPKSVIRLFIYGVRLPSNSFLFIYSLRW